MSSATQSKQFLDLGNPLVEVLIARTREEQP